MSALRTTVRSVLAVALPTVLAACGSSGNPLLPQLRPVDGGWISSSFGQREQHPVLGFVAGRTHAGYDFAVADGTPIKATMPGEVVFAGVKGGYGKTVILAHDDGLTTLYGHARALRVGLGDRVAAGEVIAFVGSTGLSTGPHLHYELRKHGVAIDPGAFLPAGVRPAAHEAASPRPAAPARGTPPGGTNPVGAVSPRATVPRAASPHRAAVLAWDGEVPVRRPAKTGE